jgi:peroxiredoxin
VLTWQQVALRQLRAQVAGPVHSAGPAEGLSAGVVAPEFALPVVEGGEQTLGGLLTGGLPVVLVFVHPGCGPCELIAGELPRWRQRRAGELEIAVISSGSVEDNRLWASRHSIPGVLLQDRYEVARRYRLRGTPDAVLIGPDGRVRVGVAGGPAGIRELLATAVPR